MQISVKNRSSKPLGHMESYLKSFLPFAQKRMGFNRPPSIFFDSDEENSKNVLGKTAHYNPESMEVVVYVDGRHPKDVIRSLSHELVHHTQNCRGDLNSDIAGETELGYAQNNPHMRNMESEAYEKGNLCMRDWEDSVKVQLQETNYYHTNGDGKQMDKYKHIVETTAKRVAAKIREANAKKIDNNIEEGDAFAPSHYCVHHGGVQHEGKIHMAEAVGHNWSKESKRATHYDMKLEDGSVLENIAFEDIQVTNASLAENHKHPMKRDDDTEDEEELEERRRVRTGGEDRARGDIQPDRIREGEEEEEELDEGMVDQMIADCEERGGTWNGDASSPDRGCSKAGYEYSDGARANAAAGAEINESNDQWYQRNLFENLAKKWAK